MHPSVFPRHRRGISLDDLTPLQTAVVVDNLEALKMLVDLGANIEVKHDVGLDLIGLAAELDRVEIAEYLVELGWDFMTPSETSHYIHTAAMNGNIEFVKLCLEKGIDINLKSFEGRGDTPLHAAAIQGKLEMVKFLVEQGADVNAESEDGVTPIDLAADSGHSDVSRPSNPPVCDIALPPLKGKKKFIHSFRFGQVVEYLQSVGGLAPQELDQTFADLGADGIPKVLAESKSPEVIAHVGRIRKEKERQEMETLRAKYEEMLLQRKEEEEQRRRKEEEEAERQAYREMAEQEGLDHEEL